MKPKAEPRIMKSKFQSVCRDCGQVINRGDDIIYYPATSSAAHYRCGKVMFENWQAERAAADWDDEQHRLQTQHLGM